MTGAQKKNNAQAPQLDEVWKLLEVRGWLSERSPAVRASLFEIARARVYQPGEALFTHSESPQGVYGIARGAVNIAIPREDGQEIVVHRAHPGFWAGDLALFASQKRLATLTAATEVLAAFLSKTGLSRLLEQRPELIRDFYLLSHRNVATTLQVIANLSVPRSETRLALRLLIFEQRQSAPSEWMPLSQEQLAQLTALSLPTVQRTLRQFVNQGAVELGYGRLRITDREQLLRFCN